MKLEEIKKQIQQGVNQNTETDSVEFKDARGGFPKDPVSNTVSAFANTKGGIIVFGIAEDPITRNLSIVKVDFADIQEKITQLTSNDMSVVIRLDFHFIDLESSQVLAIYIPECGNHSKPVYLKKTGMSSVYIRDGNTDRKMTEDEIKSFIKNAQGDDYDKQIAEDTSLDDLNNDKIDFFLTKSAEKVKRDFTEAKNETLKNIGIITNHNGVFLPTIAGFLIFAKGLPQKKLPFERYKIRCIRYKGSGVSSDILDSVDLDGTLDQQIDGMQHFIFKNIQKRAEIVGTKRVERYEYPEKAIREIVANAVIHRDYRITETYTQINIFEDRIEVYNPGNLPLGVTIETIRDAQMSRNKVIAGRLKDLDYLEEYGRGIDIVFTEMSKWNLLPPIFKNSSNSFKVILPGEKLSQLNDRQLKIWEKVIESQKVTRKDLEGLITDVSPETIKTDLKKMRDIGLISQKGESINTYYEANF
jgi:ATP-dependent DNA helicase RecG